MLNVGGRTAASLHILEHHLHLDGGNGSSVSTNDANISKARPDVHYSAPNIQTVMVGRALGGIFGSIGASLAGGSIADIWLPHE